MRRPAVTSSRLALLAAALAFYPMSDKAIHGTRANDLKGGVKTVRTEAAGLKVTGEGREEGRRTPLSETHYDAKGLKVKEVAFNPDGTEKTVSEYRYNEVGRLKESATYDAAGSLIGRSVYTSAGGRRNVERTDYDAGGAVMGRAVETLDASGRTTETAIYDPRGALLMKILASYDSSRRTTELKFCGGIPGASRGVKADGGDSAPTWREQKVKGGNVNPCGDGLLASRTVVRYDEEWDISEITEYDAADAVINKTAFTRDFDSRGNWVKEVKLTREAARPDLIPAEITYRTITYY